MQRLICQGVWELPSQMVPTVRALPMDQNKIFENEAHKQQWQSVHVKQTLKRHSVWIGASSSSLYIRHIMSLLHLITAQWLTIANVECKRSLKTSFILNIAKRRWCLWHCLFKNENFNGNVWRMLNLERCLYTLSLGSNQSILMLPVLNHFRNTALIFSWTQLSFIP